MDTTSHKDTRSIGGKLLLMIAVVGTIVTVMILACVLAVRGAMNQHSRPVGHDDISLDISASGDQIVFNAAGTGHWDLYLLDLATRRVRRLAETPAYELTPSFSPDAELVVYAAGLPGDRADHIFVRSIRGGNARQLTAADANDMSPKFSPDGTLVVFARDKAYNWGGLGSNWSGGGSIHVVSRDGGHERQLTPDGIYAYSPEFSSDGTSVLFFTVEGKFSVPVDGSAPPVQIGPMTDGATSPDGSLVAYARGQYAPDFELFVSNADGTGERQVTQSRKGSFKPVFTPGGDRLLFLRESWPNGPTGVPKYSLWEVSVDGEDERMIAGPDLFDSPLSWKGAAR